MPVASIEVGRAASGILSSRVERRLCFPSRSYGGEFLSSLEDSDAKWPKRTTSDHCTGKKIEVQNYEIIFKETHMLLTGRTLIRT